MVKLSVSDCESAIYAPPVIPGLPRNLTSHPFCPIIAAGAVANRYLMRKLILILIAIFAAVLPLCAQQVTDSGYRTVAHIKSDGTIYDSSYRTIGHINRDGTVYDGSYRTVGHLRDDGTVMDASYRTVGHINNDGTIYDKSYRTIGHVNSDGTIYDASYRTIGHAKGIPLQWAAFYFFFRE
jgi:hypothetical protein